MMKKYNFIHIPKNAGTSFFHLNLPNVSFNRHPFGAKSGLPNQIIIVRHPIDRFISAFSYRLDEAENLAINTYTDPNEFVKDWLAGKNSSFLCGHGYANAIIDGVKQDVGVHFCRQCLWFDEANTSFVLRYENLAADLEELSTLIGVEINLPHKNRSNKIDTELTPKTMNFLNEYYKEDFVLWRRFSKKHTIIFD